MAPSATEQMLNTMTDAVHRTRLASNAIVESLVCITEGNITASTLTNLVEALKETYDQDQRKDMLKLTDGSTHEMLRCLVDEDQNVRRATKSKMIHASLMLAKYV
ncbi:hypothetical protein PG984_011400 [Apiospora sp. TS-2023a]